ncbi:MAG: Flp family type IVb pilin [Terracidiphilus sp.]|jgi:pilus assembly protein Flp/PilA
MNNLFLKLYVKFQGLKNGQEGQDLVEYALLVSLIALTLITGISTIAKAVNNVFSNVSSSLA